MSNILFIKQSLLEEVESNKQGNLSIDRILTLKNGLSYRLEPAVLIGEELANNKKGDTYKGLILTEDEIKERGYDLYMDTIIIKDYVFKITDGFKATLVD